MKKVYFITALSLLISLGTRAQIVLDSVNMPYVGFSIEFAKDSPVTSVNYGSAGANQVYNFSSLTTTNTSTTNYTAPTATQQSHYPHADLMASADGLNFFAIRSNSSYYDAEGLQTNLSGNISYTQFTPVDTLFNIPTQYQGTFKGKWAFWQEVPGSWVNEGSVDSVILAFYDYYWDTIDGWGTIKTPLGTYNGLREARKDSTRTVIVAYIDALFGYDTVEDSYSDAVTYQYLAKETHGPVVKFDYDSGVDASVVKDVQYSLIPPAPIADFTFVTGAAGLVTFTDNSSNSPSSYHWNFGDGDTSDAKNPTHTYANDGTYYVCETVTNISGTSTYCDSVHITNVPGPVANFTWATGGGGLINFTDHSTGNPTSYSWTFGDGGTSNAADPSHTYAANGAYYVCETVSNVNGSNTYCDSVHVTGISSGHQPPVAVNDTASVTKPNSVTVDLANVDQSPTGDTFCITSISNTTYFSIASCDSITFNSTNAPAPGVDSTWYVICNIHQPTLCDSALLIITVEKAHIAPVAVNVYDTTTQPSPITFNVTANDNSPSGDTFCLTSIYPPAGYTIVNCDSVTYAPDSTFTGNDTVHYVICNVGQPSLCDTAEIIVTDQPNSVLLPVASFTDSLSGFQNGGGCLDPGQGRAMLKNTSIRADSILWSFNVATNVYCDSANDSKVSDIDSITIIPDGFFGSCGGFSSIYVCLTAYNQYGSNSKCDTICVGAWESINDLSLPNISIYPNPANNVLTVDMRNNTDAITTDYTSIDIYNAIGQQVLSQPHGSNYKVAEIPVTALPEGMYLATIVDGKGVRRTLGRFTVVR